MADSRRRAAATRQGDRLSAILDRLASTGSVSVGATALELGVSNATVRRDLAVLREQNLLDRTHGGATAREVDYELPVRYRNGHEHKRRIARAAIRRLPSGRSVVAINGGTTTSEVARLLATRTELTVVTNALNIAMVLVMRPRVRLVLTGGVARSRSYELVGPWTERSLGGIRIGTAFIGVDGISAARGISTHDEVEAHANAVMINRAHHVVVVADGSKIGRNLLAHTVDLTAIDELVTDSTADPTELDAIRACGVSVLIADEAPR